VLSVKLAPVKHYRRVGECAPKRSVHFARQPDCLNAAADPCEEGFCNFNERRIVVDVQIPWSAGRRLMHSARLPLVRDLESR
jgi:hypothetical protein